MMEPCGNQTAHAGHHYIAADSNGYLCPGVAQVDDLERQLAATVDELTEAQTENARLAALAVEAFEQRDAAQTARAQAEKMARDTNAACIEHWNRADRAEAHLAAERAVHQRAKTLLHLAQAAREQAEAQRDRALEQLAAAERDRTEAWRRNGEVIAQLADARDEINGLDS